MISKKYCEKFCKSTETCSANNKRCSENMLSFLQKYRECSAETLKVALQKHWKVFCKNTEKCSVKYLEVFCKIARGEFQTFTQHGQIPLKNSRTWCVFCYIMACYFRRPKYDMQLLRVKSFANFWYPLNHEKGYTDERGSLIYR